MDTVTRGAECRKWHPSLKRSYSGQTGLTKMKPNGNISCLVISFGLGWVFWVPSLISESICSIRMQSLRGCLPTTVHNLARCVIFCIKILIINYYFGGLNQNNFGSSFWAIKMLRKRKKLFWLSAKGKKYFENAIQVLKDVQKFSTFFWDKVVHHFSSTANSTFYFLSLLERKHRPPATSLSSIASLRALMKFGLKEMHLILLPLHSKDMDWLRKKKKK